MTTETTRKISPMERRLLRQIGKFNAKVYNASSTLPNSEELCRIYALSAQIGNILTEYEVKRGEIEV